MCEVFELVQRFRHRRSLCICDLFFFDLPGVGRKGARVYRTQTCTEGLRTHYRTCAKIIQSHQPYENGTISGAPSLSFSLPSSYGPCVKDLHAKKDRSISGAYRQGARLSISVLIYTVIEKERGGRERERQKERKKERKKESKEGRKKDRKREREKEIKRKK